MQDETIRVQRVFATFNLSCNLGRVFQLGLFLLVPLHILLAPNTKHEKYFLCHSHISDYIIRKLLFDSEITYGIARQPETEEKIRGTLLLSMAFQSIFLNNGIPDYIIHKYGFESSFWIL